MSDFGGSASKHVEQKHEKKKFDKKKLWDNKYSKKRKVEHWEEKRKQMALKKLQRQFKKENISQHKPIPYSDSPKEVHNYRRSKILEKKLEIQRLKEQKVREKEAEIKKKEEMKAALEQYKKRKAEKFKKLSKKTKRGQPVMKDRLQILYEEIKQKIGDGT